MVEVTGVVVWQDSLLSSDAGERLTAETAWYASLSIEAADAASEEEASGTEEAEYACCCRW